VGYSTIDSTSPTYNTYHQEAGRGLDASTSLVSSAAKELPPRQRQAQRSWLTPMACNSGNAGLPCPGVCLNNARAASIAMADSNAWQLGQRRITLPWRVLFVTPERPASPCPTSRSYTAHNTGSDQQGSGQSLTQRDSGPTQTSALFVRMQKKSHQRCASSGHAAPHAS
jgi:hypothetical protein